MKEKIHTKFNSIKKDSGITLLALIVTIIIMLILAGVTISGVMGDDGIISKAITAIQGWETSEEKEVLAISYSALLMDQELYDEEITDTRMKKEIIHNGKEADVRIHEDYKNILVIKFKKTGNVYWIHLEDGRVEYKGKNTEEYDDKELNEGDIIFESSPTKWTNKEVKTTIKVKEGVNMKNLQLQWTKTPGNQNSWKEYTNETEIISEKNETIYARIREKLTDYTELQASTKIENIDKLAPEGEIEVKTTTNSARVTIKANDKSATTEYGNSGIKGYYYRKDETSEWSEITTATTYQFTNLIQTTEYNFQVKIEDNAGNTTVVSGEENTETVPTPTNVDLRYTTSWDGTNATVTFTTTAEFWMQTSIDGINWTNENPIIVTSGTQVYVRYSDGTNQGMKYAAVKPLWTGTVTYNSNGGTGGPSAQNAQHTTTVTVNFSSNPTRTGYTFQGWNTKADGTGTSYTSNGTKTFTMGTSNVTLYAQWKVNTYIVTYNYATNGGTSATKTIASVNYGSTIDLSPTATKSGYTFVGWNTSSSATTKLSSLTMGTSNVTLYAIYSKTITAKWYYYNGTSYTNSDTTVTVYNNTTSGTPGKPTVSNPSGWTARGWSTNNAPNATVATPGAISSNTTYYYSWSKSVTISYNTNSGSGAPSAQTGTAYLNYAGVASSARITISTTKPTRTGYTFQGWDTSSVATSATYTSGNPFSFSSSATLYAVWKDSTAPTKPTVSIASKGYKDFTVTMNSSDSGTGLHHYTLYYRLPTSSGTASSYSSKQINTSASSYTETLTCSYGGTAYVYVIATDGAENKSTASDTKNVTNSTYTIKYEGYSSAGVSSWTAPSTQYKYYGRSISFASNGSSYYMSGAGQMKHAGWVTSSSEVTSARCATYAGGESYSSNASITLYPYYASCKIGEKGYTDLYEAIAYSSGTCTITMLRTGTYDQTLTIPSGRHIVIDTNGCSYTYRGTDNFIKNNGYLTINGSGTITSEATGRATIVTYAGGTFNLSDATISSKLDGAIACYGDTTINSGKVQGGTGTDAYGIYLGGCTLTINGGEISASKNHTIRTQSENATININGGTISNSDGYLHSIINLAHSGSVCRITGGTLTGGTYTGSCVNLETAGTTLYLSGGTLNAGAVSKRAINIATGAGYGGPGNATINGTVQWN